jgi:mono/diheme cytochrome c family protein
MKQAMQQLEKISYGRVVRAAGLLLVCGVTLLGCHPDMWDQPRFAAYQKSDFYADGAASRPHVPGTVTYLGARRHWTSPVFKEITGSATVPTPNEPGFWNGKANGKFVADNYFLQGSVTPEQKKALIKRGQERYNVTCLPCHGPDGDGKGIIVQRGFPQPPSYHIDRLREVEDGYIVDVITNGFGRMYNYAARVTPEDRWAIAAYLRALQFSQNVNVSDAASAAAQEVAAGIAAQEEAQKAAAKAAEHTEGGHAH